MTDAKRIYTVTLPDGRTEKRTTRHFYSHCLAVLGQGAERWAAWSFHRSKELAEGEEQKVRRLWPGDKTRIIPLSQPKAEARPRPPRPPRTRS